MVQNHSEIKVKIQQDSSLVDIGLPGNPFMFSVLSSDMFLTALVR